MKGLRALAKLPEQWLEKPNRFDFPDVDTPTDKRALRFLKKNKTDA